MKIVYITAHTPFGKGEAFILEEMLVLAEAGIDLIIIPRNPPKGVFHKDAHRLMGNTVWLPLLDRRMLVAFLRALIFRPSIWKIIRQIWRHSRSLQITLKNLAVLPKAIFVANFLESKKVDHIHAHWGSTTSTMAWVISKLTGIPWSITLHRWDIAENNMLKLKVEQASFARCISRDGRDEVLGIVGTNLAHKVMVLHMGVRMPERPSFGLQNLRQEFVVACPANFVPKKGHRFLIEACKLLYDEGYSQLRCLLIGDGPLEEEIREGVARYGLDGIVHLTGRLPHEALMKMYEGGEVDAVVLPSIITKDGEKEGIPVALMEAMAYGIPVISTTVGGIPELLSDGAGILVPPASAKALAVAIRELIEDRDMREKLGRKGHERVWAEFDLEKNVRKLVSLMREHATK